MSRPHSFRTEFEVVQTRAIDKNERRVLDDIREHGWHIISIPEDDEGPGYAFSIGLFETLKHPEIILFGLDPFEGFDVINVLGESIRQGKRFGPLQEVKVGSGSQRRLFAPIPRTAYRDYLGFANWYYQGTDYPVFQCVWSDRQGHFPFETGCDDYVTSVQPLLARQLSWPFRESPDTLCFTTRCVADRQSPILHVFHDEEGDWQFLCGTTNLSKDARVISLRQLTDQCEEILDLADLPIGWQATRSRAGTVWNRSPISG